VKWTEVSDELPGWYKAKAVHADGSCTDNDCEVSEVINLTAVGKPCSRKSVPLHGNPAIAKSNWKSSPKLVDSTEYMRTLIFNDFDTHVSELQTVDKRAVDLDLSFKPAKCVSYLFDSQTFTERYTFIEGHH